ncbi:MAG: hypothetical protein NVS4B11_38960 [Ktedonobacteraceae bacterium]
MSPPQLGFANTNGRSSCSTSLSSIFMRTRFTGAHLIGHNRYHHTQMLLHKAACTRQHALCRVYCQEIHNNNNGKEEDFQLFLRLLDGDRFEGKFRDGVHKVDVSDLMRHLVKEQLYRFDGTPLFPERLAYTLSGQEQTLYDEVTDYVR